MSSTVIAKNVQIGADGTASNNFTIFQPATPDGTLRIGNGNTGITSSLVTLTSAGAFSVTGTTTTTLSVAGNNISAVNSLGFRNRIINGAMGIDQRNAGASVTITTANPYTLDRWQAICSVSSKFTVQQTPSATETGYATRVAAGFTNYLGCTSSAATSVGSGDYYLIRQSIEGLNFSDLAWGTASAKSVTLSFWVYSSLTGTFGGALGNSANNRTYPFTYTISAANTWEQKTVTVAGDTTGTWLTTNGIGIKLTFSLGMGSTYSGTAGSWAGAEYYSATGATSVVGTSGATFYITGVQLEAGSTATSFDRRPYGTELALCQRYYIRGDTYGSGMSFIFPVANQYQSVQFPVAMRARPTMVIQTNPSATVSGVDSGFYGFRASSTLGPQDAVYQATAEL